MPSQQRPCFQLCTAGGVLALSLLPSAALATYSIAATDSQSQEVGGAITSCVGALDVGVVYGSVPGVGVVHAQAQLDQRGRGKARALELLGQGATPAAIVSEITRRELDPSFAARQYGVVDLSGRAAGFTGDQAQAYKSDQQGAFGSFAYSVQGNILTSQAVLDQSSQAFQAPACDLAERLMRALEAGAEHGEGDSRCTDAGIPADSAFIQVDRPGQNEPYLQLSVSGTRPNNPLPQLRQMFDAWRMTHPCPSSSAAAGSGGSSAAAGSGGISAAEGSSGISAAGGAADAAGAASPDTSAGASATTAGTSAPMAAAAAPVTAGRTAAAPPSSSSTMGPSSERAGTGGASPIEPNTVSTAVTEPPRNTTASVTQAMERAPRTADSGCSTTGAGPHSGPTELLIGLLTWLTIRSRRSCVRRATIRHRDVAQRSHPTETSQPGQ